VVALNAADLRLGAKLRIGSDASGVAKTIRKKMRH
jgi:hypothetical protein